MKRSFLAFLPFVAIFAADAAVGQEEQATWVAGDPECVPGEFIVKYRTDTSAEQRLTVAASVGIETIRDLELIGAQLVRADESRQEAVANLALSSAVEWFECNYRQEIVRTPDDGDFSQQWGLPKISAPAAWDQATDAPNVILAIVDTGVDYRHVDLAANMWRNPAEVPNNGQDDDGNGIVDDVFGANFVPQTATGDPLDDNNHGTHVAGIAAAVTNNAAGIAGTTWKTQIMALKFLNARGSGSTSNAIRAIDYAIKHGADIINSSWGGGPFSRALELAIQRADQAGVLFAAAAGNTPTDNDERPHYPSSYEVPNVIAVMATNELDQKAGFSAFGRRSVDLAAPGTNILSTVRNNSFDSFNGTSMATPFVSGAAALLKAVEPRWQAPKLKQRLMATVDKLPSLLGKSVSEGRLNLAAALPVVAACPKEPSLLAYDEFFHVDRKTFSSNANVLSVTFTLPRTMYVTVTTNGSAELVNASGTNRYTTGIYNQTPANVMWTGSLRRATYASVGQASPVTTSFSIRLASGTHTMYWKLWLSGFELRFHSANLTVEAVPCSMGGKLSALGVEALEDQLTILTDEGEITALRVVSDRQ